MMMTIKQSLKTASLAVCALAVVAAYSANALAKEVFLSQKENNVHLTAAVGDKIVIKLEANPTTGYGWKFHLVPSDGALRILKNEFVPKENAWGLMGAGGTQELILKVVKKGDAVVTGRYYREWEGFNPKEDTQVQYSIYVR